MQKPIKSPVVWSLGLWSTGSLGAARQLLEGYGQPLLVPVGGADAFSLPSLSCMAAGVPGVARTFSAPVGASERDAQTVGNRAVAGLLAQLRASPVVSCQLFVTAAWVSSHESKNREGNLVAYRQFGMAARPHGSSSWKDMGEKANQVGFEPCAGVVMESNGVWRAEAIEQAFCAHLSAKEERRGWDRANGTKPELLVQSVQQSLDEVVGALSTPEVRKVLMNRLLPPSSSGAFVRSRF